MIKMLLELQIKKKQVKEEEIEQDKLQDPVQIGNFNTNEPIF